MKGKRKYKYRHVGAKTFPFGNSIETRPEEVTRRDMFKSITVDNGCEFSDYAGMETSPYTRKQRTAGYYLHPYCSGERGTNENYNRFLRRYVSKGTPVFTVPPNFL